MMGRVWMIYFMASIAVVGGIFSYFGAVPSYLLSKRFPKLKAWGDQFLFKGTKLLMSVQPWYKPKLNFSKFEEIRAQHPRVLFVANHRSHLDVFVLLTQIPGIRIFANKYLFKVPFLGQLMKHTGQIPVEQNRLDKFVESIEKLKGKMVEGENTFVFPELTRCQQGQRGTQNFSTMPFKAAMEAQAVVVPVVIKNTDSVWPKGKMSIGWQVPVEFEMLDPVPSQNFSSAAELTSYVKTQIDRNLR